MAFACVRQITMVETNLMYHIVFFKEILDLPP